MSTYVANLSRFSPDSQAGLSLVELMISLTIGLILLLGITTLIVQQSSSRDELEKSSRQIENGRYAMQVLHDEIEHAGFYGENFTQLTPPPTLPDPCTTSVTQLLPAMALPIQGYNAPATSPVTCIPNANHKAGTDILVIRRSATELESGGMNPSVPPEVLIQTTVASYVMSTVTTPFNTNNPPLPSPFILTKKDGTTPAALREYWVHIYFISPCSIPAGGGTTCTGAADDNGKPIPTLKMLDITGETAALGPIPLVEGIEDMQLDYGLDADNDGYPDSYSMAPVTATDWSSVMAIRVNLLARNTECSTGYTDTKTYNLGLAGSISAPTDACNNGGYKRHVFSETVRAINPSGRRAQQ